MARLYFSSGTDAKKMARLRERGELFRIRRGIYIDTDDPDETRHTLEEKWPDIACHLYGETVAVARTAAELRPIRGRLYCISGELSAKRTIRVGHLLFDIAPGVVDEGVEQFTLNMKRSNPARMCLENLTASSWPPPPVGQP